MELKDPKVSIVVPVWNSVLYIEEMINSVISQCYNNWELILVDDGCTDGTTEILRQYSEKDARIYYYLRNKLPKGGQTCRNIGIEKSSGEYIVFFDSDDIVASYCLSQRVNFMMSHSDLDFAVFPAQEFIYKKGDSLKCFGVKKREDVLSSFFRGEMTFSGWTNIYRKQSLISKNVYWDTSLLSLQDWFFFIETILKDFKYEYAMNVQVDYYVRTKININSVSKLAYSIHHLSSHIYYFSRVKNLIRLKYSDKYDKDLLYHGLNIILTRGRFNELEFVKSFRTCFFDILGYNICIDIRLRLYPKILSLGINRRYAKIICFPIYSFKQLILILKNNNL